MASLLDENTGIGGLYGMGGGYNELFSNPLFHLGLGLLGNQDNAGAGLLKGMTSYNQAQQAQTLQLQRALQMQQTLREMKQQQAMDQYLQGQGLGQYGDIGLGKDVATLMLNRNMPSEKEMMVQRLLDAGMITEDQVPSIVTGAALYSPEQLMTQKGRENQMSVIQDINKGYLAAGQQSSGSIPGLERAEQLLVKYPNLTGPGKETAFEVAKFLNTWFDAGISEDQIPEMEQLRTLFGDLIMQRVAQTKGAVSDREMRLFSEWSPNMSNTPEGNLLMVRFALQRAKRDQTISRQIQQMMREGKTPWEINEWVNSYADENPLGVVSAMENQLRALGYDFDDQGYPVLKGEKQGSVQGLLNGYAMNPVNPFSLLG